MKILFIHQNFPGQYKHLAPALATKGHQCVALTLRVKKPTTWKGVRVLPYGIKRGQSKDCHPWLADMEAKLIRGEACMQAALKLKDAGFSPDVILAHPGWGESMFLRDVWPEARIGLYYELYYQSGEGDMGFDDEFAAPRSLQGALRIRMKNINNMLHFPLGDRGISPTRFQANSFPAAFREHIDVLHDGIDTEQAKPNPKARLKLESGRFLTPEDSVVTFVNRNLEPYRGYHIFMRSLPELLKRNPGTDFLVVGGDGQSYGPAPRADQGRNWKQIFIDEVRSEISDEDWQRVHFLGKLAYNDFLSMLQVSSVHIYLTYPFVLSWSLLEAMSIGAAIVASNTAPVKEAITHDQTGRLVEFFDQGALVKEVSGLLSDPMLRARLGDKARVHIKSNYDLRSHCLPKQVAWVESLYAMKPGGAEVFPRS